MSLAKPFLILTAVSSLGLFACGGGDDTGDDDPDVIEGDHYQYVADDIAVPTTAAEASAYALNIAGTEGVDNALGGLLATLSRLGLDVSSSVDDNVQNGTVIVLADLQATALDAATNSGMRFYLGADPSPAACTDELDPATCGQHLDGSATIGIAGNSPSDALLAGAIVGGRFSGGPGEVRLELPLTAGTDPVIINLIGARTEVAVSAGGLMSGKLGGAITMDEIETQVLPAVVSVIENIVTADCTGTAPDCCVGEVELASTGADVLELLDTNGDCTVPLEELAANDIIASTLLNADLDMLDGDTYGPDTDGEKDSLSMGVGFSGVAATFTRP